MKVRANAANASANPSRSGGGVPECFSDHVFVGDAVVGEGLAPHGVQRVVQGLGSKFVGLEEKRRTSSGSSVTLEQHQALLTLMNQVSASVKFSQKQQQQQLINMHKVASLR